MGKLDELTETIKERSNELQVAYKEAKKADKMKKSVSQLVGNIQKNGTAITKLLNNLINLSEQEMDEEKGGKS